MSIFRGPVAAPIGAHPGLHLPLPPPHGLRSRLQRTGRHRGVFFQPACDHCRRGALRTSHAFSGNTAYQLPDAPQPAMLDDILSTSPALSSNLFTQQLLARLQALEDALAELRGDVVQPVRAEGAPLPAVPSASLPDRVQMKDAATTTAVTAAVDASTQFEKAHIWEASWPRLPDGRRGRNKGYSDEEERFYLVRYPVLAHPLGSFARFLFHPDLFGAMLQDRGHVYMPFTGSEHQHWFSDFPTAHVALYALFLADGNHRLYDDLRPRLCALSGTEADRMAEHQGRVRECHPARERHESCRRRCPSDCAVAPRVWVCAALHKRRNGPVSDDHSSPLNSEITACCAPLLPTDHTAVSEAPRKRWRPFAVIPTDPRARTQQCLEAIETFRIESSANWLKWKHYANSFQCAKFPLKSIPLWRLEEFVLRFALPTPPSASRE